MKVLYIGHYREGSGWSEAALNYILALDAAGVEVVCRPVKLNDATPQLPQRILELEDRNLADVTHVIQHVLPHYMDFHRKFKNIGMYIGETNSFGVTGWRESLKLCDEVWVPNEDLHRLCIDDLPVVSRRIPHPTNITKYDIDVEPFDIPELRDKFVFYVIGEWNRRKHISALLRAFHAEFEPEDNVGLVLKVNKPGWDPYSLQDFCRQNSLDCKQQLRKFAKIEYYHNELFFCDYLNESDLAALHKTCDCFVNTSYGEAWSYPTFDAMGFGNLVISSNCGGMRDYIQQGFLVDGEYVPCMAADPPFNDLQTANEEWFEISIPKLQKTMRKAYELGDEERACKQNWGKRLVQEYSYEKVGKLMKEALEHVE